MVHVCFGLYDKTGCYSKFTGTTMLSLFESIKSSVTIHIFHDNTLTEDNRDKFLELTNRYSQIVEFYNIEELCADKLFTLKEILPNTYYTEHFTMGMFYRLFIADILPTEIKKVIYLDADIIVNLDINELWQIEVSDYPLAVVLEIDNGVPISKHSSMCRDGVIKEENYFNSGVLVMNLEILRKEEENILIGIKFIGEHPKYNIGDQDVLNYCFSTRTLKLPVKFNRLIRDSRNSRIFSMGKMIYHYAGGKNGLGLDMSDPFNRLWWSYFIRTPWFGVDIIDKIFKSATDSMLQISAMTHDKTRAFIVDEEHAYQIERNFSILDKEEVFIVDTKSKECLSRLTKLINDSRNKKIFFVGIPNIDLKLPEMGFVRNKDFFDVCGFYSPMWADLTSNYKLILSM